MVEKYVTRKGAQGAQKRPWQSISGENEKWLKFRSFIYHTMYELRTIFTEGLSCSDRQRGVGRGRGKKRIECTL
jgi:hypothetical protein